MVKNAFPQLSFLDRKHPNHILIEVHIIQKRYIIAEESSSSNNHVSWDMSVLVGVTSTIKREKNMTYIASQTGRSYRSAICVEYVDGIQHPSPPVDWILDLPDPKMGSACKCCEVLSIALLQMTSLVEMFSSTRRGWDKFLAFWHNKVTF